MPNMKSAEQHDDKFDAVLVVPGDDEGERMRRLRRASKLLLRVCGVRILTMQPTSGGRQRWASPGGSSLDRQGFGE